MSRSISNDIVIISYYTDNWNYPKKANELKQNCESLKLDYRIEKLDDTGSWINNTRLKSKFVHENLEEIQRPVLWIDADSTLYRTPFSISSRADFAAVRADRNKTKTFYAGTLYFDYTRRGRDFARRWAECNIDGSDHMALEHVWQEGFEGLVHCLPQTYCELESKGPPSEKVIIYSGSSRDESKQKYMTKQSLIQRSRRRRR